MTRTFQDYYRIINVKDYGAIGDGVTDDTAAIQAAFDACMEQNSLGQSGRGGRIYMPQGTYSVGDLHLYRSPTATNVTVVLEGASPNATKLTYTGTGACITTKSLFGFQLQDFAISRASGGLGTNGSTIGIRLAAAGGGTGTTVGTIERVGLENFAYGISSGMSADGLGCSSEVSYISCGWSSCDTGFYMEDFNALDHSFYNCTWQTNTYGIRLNEAGGMIHVHGGSSSGNAYDFYFKAVYGPITVSNFRSETCSTACVRVGNAMLTLTGCLLVGDATTRAVLFEDNASLVAINTHFGGEIFCAHQSHGQINLISCSMITASTLEELPIRCDSTSGDLSTHYRVIGCWAASGAGSPNAPGDFTSIPDQEGRFLGDALGTRLSPLPQSGSEYLGDAIGPMNLCTVSQLNTYCPATDLSKGLRAWVKDATATTFASVVAGTGANIVPVYCDGTNWRIG